MKTIDGKSVDLAKPAFYSGGVLPRLAACSNDAFRQVFFHRYSLARMGWSPKRSFQRHPAEEMFFGDFGSVGK